MGVKDAGVQRKRYHILPTLEQEITGTPSTLNKPHIDPLSVDAVIKSQWMVSLSVD